MRRTIAIVAAATVVVAFAGCSGSDDAGSTSEPSDSAAVTEPADTEPADTEPADTEPADTDPADTEPLDTEPADTEPADTEPADTEPADPSVDPADQAIADAALLTLDDMPQNWTESPLEEDEDEPVTPEIEAAQAQFVGCFGVEFSDDGDPFGLGGARASSGEFRGNTDFTITNKVAIADDAGTERVMAQYTDPSVPACVAPAMTAVLEAGFAADPAYADFVIGDVTVDVLDLTQWGDGTIGYRTYVPVTGPDGGFELYMDQVVVRVGRGLSALQFQSPGSPFEVFEVDSYAMLSAEKLEAALA